MIILDSNLIFSMIFLIELSVSIPVWIHSTGNLSGIGFVTFSESIYSEIFDLVLSTFLKHVSFLAPFS